MNGSKTAADDMRAERLEIARRVFEALVLQDANRTITLCDSDGRVIAKHDLLPSHLDTAP
jgi:hypothetical protein